MSILILLPGVRYQDFDKLYNLRNRDCYNIDNRLKFKKFMEVIREQFNLTSWNENDISNFHTAIYEARKKYLPYISTESQCRLKCEKPLDELTAAKFRQEIIQEKLVETIICKKVKSSIEEYYVYMWPGKTITDLQNYLDKNGYDNCIINRLS